MKTKKYFLGIFTCISLFVIGMGCQYKNERTANEIKEDSLWLIRFDSINKIKYDSVNKNGSSSISSSTRPIQDDFNVCYAARDLVKKYVKNPLEAEIDSDCSSVEWIEKKGYWEVTGTGSTKTDFGVRKRFLFVMHITYLSSSDSWHSYSCNVVALD